MARTNALAGSAEAFQSLWDQTLSVPIVYATFKRNFLENLPSGELETVARTIRSGGIAATRLDPSHPPLHQRAIEPESRGRSTLDLAIAGARRPDTPGGLCPRFAIGLAAHRGVRRARAFETVGGSRRLSAKRTRRAGLEIDEMNLSRGAGDRRAAPNSRTGRFYETNPRNGRSALFVVNLMCD